MMPQRDQTTYDDVAHFIEAARGKLHAAPADTIFTPHGVPDRTLMRSDFDLDPGLAAEIGMPVDPRRAAVLVPIVRHRAPTVLLTRRTEHLPSHAGQISFPGGKLELGESALDAALREAEEEIGLDRRHIAPIGYLDSYITGTGFHITPVVALVEPGFSLTLDHDEVAAVFEVPLAFMLDPANHAKHAREWHGRQRHFYAIEFGSHYIWGATAGMIRNLHERLTKA